MSTVKISQLPQISAINANTQQTLFAGVDVPTNITGKFTAHTLAQGLYSNEVLNVGINQQNLPNTVAQFSLSGESYIQTNLVNTNDGGTADIVVTANVGSGGSDSTNFIDMGWANKNYQPGLEFNNIGNSVNPNDGYLYSQGTSGQPYGNLIVGATSSGAQIKFVAGGGQAANIVARMTSTGLVLNTQSSITFSDGSIQSTAANPASYSTAAFGLANTTSANTIYTQGVDATQNTNITAVNTFVQSAYNVANTANAGFNYQTGVDITQNTATSLAAANTVYLQGALNTANANSVINSTIAKNAYNQANTANGIANTAVQNTTIITVNNINATGNITASYLFGNVIGSTVQNTINWLTTTVQPVQQTGQLFFYANTTSLVLDTDIANNRISVSKTIYFRAFNSTGVTIPANSWVRLIPGVTPNTVPYIALADATTSANSTVAGFVVTPIANSAYGIVYQSGLVEEFNSTGLGSLGDILFLSATPGQASNVAPTGSNTVVQLGRIINSDPLLGKIQIATQLRQAYGRPNGSVLYAYANNITSSNTISINDSTGVLNTNTTIANTFVYASATANSMVTQLSSKSTAVTANGITGQITMNNAALAGQAYTNFTVNNSYVQHVNDIIIVNVQNGVTSPNPYIVTVGKVAAGSFNITVYNADSGGGSSHSDAIVLNWAVMRVGS